MDEWIERTRRLGSFLIVLALVLWALDAVAGTYRASLLGLLLAIVGTGLRIETAVAEAARRVRARVE